MELLVNLVISLVGTAGDSIFYPDYPLQEAQVRVISQKECQERFAELNVTMTVTEEIICVDKLNENDPPTRTCFV